MLYDTPGYIQILDFFGTAVFALTGALKAIRHNLDVLGIMIMAVITGVGGGILRDIVLGSTPPAVFHNELYLVISVGAGLLVFFIAPLLKKEWRIIRWADAVGLSTFTVIGCSKGMNCHLGLVGILFSGVLTATGGGIIRDILVCEIPVVISRDFYAMASLLGGLLFCLIHPLNLSSSLRMGLPILFTFILRVFAMQLDLNLPKAKYSLSDTDRNNTSS